MGKRIYIAGKISGLSEQEYHNRFKAATDYIGKQGHIPINPVDTSHFGLPYDMQMKLCKILLESCNAIYLLSNWKDSFGAKQEKQWADEKGLEIIYEKG